MKFHNTLTVGGHEMELSTESELSHWPFFLIVCRIKILYFIEIYFLKIFLLTEFLSDDPDFFMKIFSFNLMLALPPGPRHNKKLLAKFFLNNF